MVKHIIIYLSLFLIYYHIGGLATTNILRLTKGCKPPVLSSKCVCDNCGDTIPPLLQLPIVSYIICKGKCKNCGSKIQISSLFLELAVMLGMFIISVALKLSVKGVTFSFIYYEIVRVLTVTVKKKRETDFAKNYIISVLSMLPFYVSALFAALIYSQI